VTTETLRMLHNEGPKIPVVRIAEYLGVSVRAIKRKMLRPPSASLDFPPDVMQKLRSLIDKSISVHP